MLYLHIIQGRAIAQAVSHQLPTAEARVRAKVTLCEICGGQTGIRSPLPITIPPTAPQSSSCGADKIGQRVANVPSGHTFALPQET
jgi:hypothetical protein